VAFRYEVVAFTRLGRERRHPYTTAEPLEPGAVITLGGRNWLIERVEPAEDEGAGRAHARPARYRLRLRHPDGHEELGAMRRWRPDAPGLGHTFTTIADGAPISWQIMEAGLAYDEQGEPYLDLLAERDYSELEELPDHELEHTLARDDAIPEGTEEILRRGQDDLSVELVALEAGEAPDWDEAVRYIDALELVEIEDDLIELCGVDPDRDPRATWLDKVKERLRSDLELLRADIEGDHDEIEEWDFRGGRVFAAVGTFEDEADPGKGHGWMSRLVDASALAAAGLHRIRKAELELP
jgi:hypothetical protein